MGHFLLGPVQKQRAMMFEELLQLLSAERLDQTGFLFADDVEIHQRQVDLRQLQLAAHQPAVDLRLRPVQLPVVGRLFAQVAAIGFDFFQAVLPGIIAIRPALHVQGFVRAFQGDFTLITVAAPGRDRAVPDDAFQRRR